MYFSNAAVDVVYALSERHHFDDETFEMGRDLITAGQQPVPPLDPLVTPSVRLLSFACWGDAQKLVLVITLLLL